MFLARPILNAVAFYEPESYSAEQWFADHFAVRPAPDAQGLPSAQACIVAGREITGHGGAETVSAPLWPTQIGRAINPDLRWFSARGGRHGVLQWVWHATRCGHPVPLITGDYLPRHVVLALPGREPSPELEIYEPASGQIFTVALFAMKNRATALPAFGNWRKLVFAVLPYPKEKK